MELIKRFRVALGIATLMEVAFPLLLVLLYMLTFFLIPMMMASNPNGEESIVVFFVIGMVIFFPLMMFFTIFQFTMKAIYLFLLIGNERSKDMMKVLFVLGTFYIPLIAMPLYYVLDILKEENKEKVIQDFGETVSPASFQEPNQR